ncbi:MAG: helix-turn-helix domain-containing protein [Burkholderiales bacterium]|nr:helix-turn-helix domain-containing protein [Burkholderiales bacterium]
MVNFIAENLAMLMREHGLSGNDLSLQINIPTATIQKLRSGDIRNPTIETLAPIAEYFKLSLDELVLSKLSEVQNSKIESSNLIIPLIKLSDISNFPNCDVVEYIRYSFGDDATDKLAIKVQELGLLFELGSILFVDKSASAKNQDYVIVKHLHTGNISIKKVLFDDDYYLMSIVKGLDNKMLDIKDYHICGVIISSLNFF